MELGDDALSVYASRRWVGHIYMCSYMVSVGMGHLRIELEHIPYMQHVLCSDKTGYRLQICRVDFQEALLGSCVPRLVGPPHGPMLVGRLTGKGLRELEPSSLCQV